MKLNFYDILNIPFEATPEQIKKAYRDLSKEHHPDCGGNEDEFNTILKAYETLSDPILRADYDKYGTGKDVIINIAMTIFKDIMKSDPVDISEALKNSHIEDMIQIDRAISGLQKEMDKLSGITSRIKKAPTCDFIRESLEAVKSKIQLQIEQFKENKESAGLAYDMLGDYQFEAGEGRANRIILTSSVYNSYMGI